MDRIRVLVVDDHPAFAQGLRLLLERDPRIAVVGTAGTVASAVEMACSLAPDVVLMDQCLGAEAGTAAVDRIRSVRPDCAVIVLTGAPTMTVVSEAAEAGAAGVLGKVVEPDELVRAIERARRGENLFSPVVLAEAARARAVRERQAADRERTLERLTPREHDVLGLLAEGCDSKAIATTLGVSVQSARSYVQNVLEKLDAHSRVEAILTAARLGLVRRGA